MGCHVHDVRAPQTWQVPRAAFDHLLLRHAAASDVDVRERHRVLDVAFDDNGVTVTVQGAEGGSAPGAVRAQAIIDASGRGALLSRKFNLRIDEPGLANLAVFSHYSGVPRQEGRRAGDIRIVAREDLGWFWMIPICGELMSVGVVLPRSAARALQGMEPGVLLDRTIADTPVVARLLASARREWPVRVERDFSFGSRAYAGERWVLAGDAGSFLDPVFSTGVAIALESGLEAAQAVAAGLAAGDLSVRRFSLFARRQRQRYRAFRRFVLGFYTPEFRDLFFADDPPRGMFAALVTVFAGYWRPSRATRVRVALFFQLVRLRRWVRFSGRLFARQPDVQESTTATR
jgi:flavin-dependent dehydrogenase